MGAGNVGEEAVLKEAVPVAEHTVEVEQVVDHPVLGRVVQILGELDLVEVVVPSEVEVHDD